MLAPPLRARPPAGTEGMERALRLEGRQGIRPGVRVRVEVGFAATCVSPIQLSVGPKLLQLTHTDKLGPEGSKGARIGAGLKLGVTGTSQGHGLN